MREPFGHCAKYAVLFYSPERRLQIAQGFCRHPPRCLPCGLLLEIKAWFGTGALLAAEATLFGRCFVFALLLDLLPRRMLPAGGILGFLCCMAAFSLCGEDRSRSLTKFCYLLCVLALGGSRLIAVGFLLVFEHITITLEKDGGGAS